MSNLDRYRPDEPIHVYQDAYPKSVVYRPSSEQPASQNLKEQIQFARDIQGIRTNETFGKLALWAIAGTFSLVGLAFAASIIKGMFTPAPSLQPMPTPSASPSPIVVRENPNCYAFCGGSN